MQSHPERRVEISEKGLVGRLWGKLKGPQLPAQERPPAQEDSAKTEPGAYERKAEIGRKRLPLAAVSEERSKQPIALPPPPTPPDVRPEHVLIKGYVAKDPVLKERQGIPYVRIHIGATAMTSDGRLQDHNVDKWHSTVFFGKEAREMAHRLSAGTKITVEGDRLLSQHKSEGGRELHRSNIVNQRLEVAKEQELPRVEVSGKVAVQPALQAKDGRLFTKVLLEASSVEVNGVAKSCRTSGERWQTAIFQGEAAKEVVARAARGTTVQIRGDLTTVAWSQDGQRFTSNEIRNSTFVVLEQARQTPAQGRERTEERSR